MDIFYEKSNVSKSPKILRTPPFYLLTHFGNIASFGHLQKFHRRKHPIILDIIFSFNFSDYLFSDYGKTALCIGNSRPDFTFRI